MRIPKTHKKILLLVVFMFLAIFTLFTGEAWVVWHIGLNVNERNLGERLITIGESVRGFLEINYSEFLNLLCNETQMDRKVWLSYSKSPTLQNLEILLEEFQDRAQLRAVQILCPGQWIIASTNDELPAGEMSPYLKIDELEINRVFQDGNPVTTLFYQIKDNPYKRAYIPLKNADGKVVGILRMEASRGYFMGLKRFSRHLIILGLLIASLLMGLFYIFTRLLRSVLRAEQAMTESERFQAMGTLSAGLAHELRNPLGIIRATTENLLEVTPVGDHETKKLLTYIVEETERLNQLIMQFLQLAREEPPNAKLIECDVIKVVESVLSLTKKGFEKEHIRFEMNPNGSLPLAAIPEQTLRQILLNILINSRDALKNQSEGQVKIDLHSKRSEIVILIRDNGPGISNEILRKIFNPFFTTKTSGVGLGLFISKSLVERYNGNLSIKSELGQGCQVFVSLPIKK